MHDCIMQCSVVCICQFFLTDIDSISSYSTVYIHCNYNYSVYVCDADDFRNFCDKNVLSWQDKKNVNVGINQFAHPFPLLCPACRALCIRGQEQGVFLQGVYCTLTILVLNFDFPSPMWSFYYKIKIHLHLCHELLYAIDENFYSYSKNFCTLTFNQLPTPLCM